MTNDRDLVAKFLKAEYGQDISAEAIAETIDEMSAEEIASVIAAVTAEPHLLSA